MNSLLLSLVFGYQVPAIKYCVVAFSMSLLSGCVTTDPITMGFLTGNTGTTMELMKGTGNAVRKSDGKTAFTFVIHDTATAYHAKDDLKGKEDFRLFQLGSWLAKVKECPNGYDVSKLVHQDPEIHAYEGFCK